MNVIGLDIGTTTISAIVLDTETGRLVDSVTVANTSPIKSEYPWEHAQNADVILASIEGILADFKAKHSPIKAIGLDGQMHGMLYVNAEGKAASPLYTWQDKRGDLPCEGGTYVSVLAEKTGYPMASGYGLTTHYWHLMNNAVPADAVSLCSIADYVGMRLTGGAKPVVHISNAASMGLYSPALRKWDPEALQKAGIGEELLPRLTDKCEVIGYADGIPVACAIGDNQASFIGSVKEPENSVLVNMGTGGQVSMMANVEGKLHLTELRPLNEGSSIAVGASLCGGRAYALLERFLYSCAQLSGYDGAPLYEAMNQCGLENLNIDNPMNVSTLFCGMRAYPDKRAAIEDIDEHNFDVRHLISATLLGMAGELRQYYDEILAHGGKPATAMVGSGNGIRKNKALKQAFEQVFGLDLVIPAHNEEAAYGAALFGYTAAGFAASLSEAAGMIQYT